LREHRKLRNYISIISSGSGFGFIIGLYIIIRLNNSSGNIYLILFTILGLFVGLLLAYYLNKNSKEDTNWYLANSSPDLDNFQDRFIDNSKDDDLIAILKDISNSELILAYTYKYYDFLINTRALLKKEIQDRSINVDEVESIYKNNVTSFNRNQHGCPNCSSPRYNREFLKENKSCVVCGFNMLRDNPETFANKLKKLFGYYLDRKLSFNELVLKLELDN
jgi:hypothetical protein